MYMLIQNGLATKQELHEYYTLDEALKLYALMVMKSDIENGIMNSKKKERG